MNHILSPAVPVNAIPVPATIAEGAARVPVIVAMLFPRTVPLNSKAFEVLTLRPRSAEFAAFLHLTNSSLPSLICPALAGFVALDL